MKRATTGIVRSTSAILTAFSVWVAPVSLQAAAPQKHDADQIHRRIAERKKDSTAKQLALLPVRLLKFPFWPIDRGTYYGFRIVDEHRLIPRYLTYRSNLTRLGVTPLLGGGVVFTGEIPNVTPSVSISGSVKGYEDYSVRPATIDLLSDGIEASLRIRYRSRPEEDFFGLGRDSRREDRTNYNLEQTCISFEVAVPIRTGGKAAARFALVNSNAFAGQDDKYPSADAFFAGRFIPGLHGGARLALAEASYTYDRRIRPGNPSGGWFARTSAAIFEDTDRDLFDFWKVRFDIQGFRPLLAVFSCHGVQHAAKHPRILCAASSRRRSRRHTPGPLWREADHDAAGS